MRGTILRRTTLGTVTVDAGTSDKVPQTYEGSSADPEYYSGSTGNVSVAVTAGDGITLECLNNGHVEGEEGGYGGYAAVTDFIRVRLYFDVTDF